MPSVFVEMAFKEEAANHPELYDKLNKEFLTATDAWDDILRTLTYLLRQQREHRASDLPIG